ncbi:MAG TPA: ABC transporter ATP-binding protein [Bacteroidales bacterium]|jgi:iron complex transport system ATP-binding protein|nr:ABC transporter ATP-binding protein [Bacteroidales bacterium]
MGDPPESKIGRDILMDDKQQIILSLAGLEIGYATSGSKRILLPPLNETACEGELIAVIGRNGVGKSTLLRTIAGLQPVISGQLLIDGRKISDYSRVQLSEKVGYISTEIVKVSNMTVYDLVSQGRFPYTGWFGRIGKKDDHVILESVGKTGLKDLVHRPVNQLSDGERQRAMIAMVLAQDAKLMIMDEPTAFLDISAKFDILHIMHDLAAERGKTILFSTHDLGMAVSRADKIWLLCDEGMQTGSPEDLVLDGAFESLFNSSEVKFNIEDGTFRLSSKEKGAVKIAGTGHEKFWTEKALIRAGFRIARSGDAPVIEVISSTPLKWNIKTISFSKQFGSLYDLIHWIKTTGSIC